MGCLPPLVVTNEIVPGYDVYLVNFDELIRIVRLLSLQCKVLISQFVDKNESSDYCLSLTQGKFETYLEKKREMFYLN